MWSLFKKERVVCPASLYWLLNEPVVVGGRLARHGTFRPTFHGMFCKSKAKTLGQVMELAGPDLMDAAALTGQMGVRSMQLVQQALDHWRQQLTGNECVLLRMFYNGLRVPDSDDPFPNLDIVPDFKDCTGMFLNTKKIGFSDLKGKVAYSLCVKVLNKEKLNGKTDSP